MFSNLSNWVVDHDGVGLEDRVNDDTTPFAVSGSVLHELMAVSPPKRESPSHLESSPLEGVNQSSLPMEKTQAEDYVTSDEEDFQVRNANPEMKSAFSINYQERKELIIANEKLLKM